jgi:hypothetical protein
MRGIGKNILFFLINTTCIINNCGGHFSTTALKVNEPIILNDYLNKKSLFFKNTKSVYLVTSKYNTEW